MTTRADGPALPAPEHTRRMRLGIPADAARVLVLTETSHWDPDWLLTSEGYFRLRVRRTLLQALDELAADPRRVYSVECIFFLRMFYERVPERRTEVRELVNAGRLRLMGSGVTTPDTIVPPTELLIRDYLLGQEWLRAHGMTAEPDVAYFPDTFGFSPGLPEVLRAVGVGSAALCRIDGMYFLGNETELPGRFPRPGSSAELLMNEHGTLDFVWRGPNGAELLCHWLAFTYGQGDMLGHAGITRQAGVPLALPWRTDRHLARRVAHYVGQLEPLARTPYLLCPIGFDFTAPIRRLVELCDRYNERWYPETGTWVVNAGLDDYLALVDRHRAELPVLELDPSQYFTGFFTSRPTLKRRYVELADTLRAAERLSLGPGQTPSTSRAVRDRLASAWWTAVVANHHDFVTGTSPDRVVHKEQLPWLDSALEAAEEVVRELAGAQVGDAVLGGDDERAPASPGEGRPTVERDGPLLTVVTATLRVVFDERLGGAITSVSDPRGAPLLGQGPSMDVVAYLDSGGLWRMGHEYAGGRFTRVDALSTRTVRLHEHVLDDGTVEIEGTGALDGHLLRRVVQIDPVAPTLRCRIEVTLRDRRTATLRIAVPHGAAHLVCDAPGGVVGRQARRWFDPTFWSVQSFAHVVRPAGGGDTPGVGLLLSLPGAIALRDDGARTIVEVVCARNAKQETAYRVVPLPAQPARGHDPGPHAFALALTFTGADDWRAAQLPARAIAEGRRARLSSELRVATLHADGVVTVDCDDVAILAAKPADRGEGAIVRLMSTAAEPRTVRVRWIGAPLTAAARCDGRERDIAPVETEDDTAIVRIDPGLTSLRVVR